MAGFSIYAVFFAALVFALPHKKWLGIALIAVAVALIYVDVTTKLAAIP